MKSKDTLQAEKTAIMQKLNQAIKDGNEEAFAEAFTEFSMNIQESVMAEAQMHGPNGRLYSPCISRSSAAHL